MMLWHENAIIYSLNVAAYMDANGDGHGDFRGLISRLDHLEKLGVTCVWLMPFFPSPRCDYGYDVSDYYSVAPNLGTLGDFVEFSHAARERGIRLLIDLPVNHTSDQHPWFQAARRDAGSEYRDYYVWSADKPDRTDEGVVFSGFQQSVWTCDEVAQAYYFHRFYKYQPDLNVKNPAVRAEICRIMGFWLELGVSGFRLDAAPFLIEEVGPHGESERHYEWLDEFRSYVSWRRGDAVLLAEANVGPAEAEAFFGDGDRVRMMFDFQTNQHLFLALARCRADPLQRSLRTSPSRPPMCQWAQFLRNHDELDLGRLSDEARSDVYEAFAPDPEMRLFDRGIRRRLAPMLKGDRRRIELAFSLLFSLPGTPILYYGDEIGMGDDLSLEERWPVRTAMQWSAGRNGGFSSAPANRLIHPVIRDGAYGVDRVNVAALQRDPDSLLNWMRRLIDVRRSCPEVGGGGWSVLETDAPSVIALSFGGPGGTVLTLHNLDAEPCAATVDWTNAESDDLIDLFGDRVYGPGWSRGVRLELDGFGYRWLRAGLL